MLGCESWFGRTTILVSYWQSPEHLQRFAADRDAPHLAPWRDFMRTVGLARATEHVPVTAGLNTARQRLRTSGMA